MGLVEFHPRHTDLLTGYLANVESDHAYIHKGWAFTYQKVITLAGSATKACILKTPASGKDIHFRPIILGTSDSPVTLEFNEGVTYTGGTDQTDQIWNRNRQLAAVRTTTCTLVDGTVTITDAGTPLPVYYIGSGTNPSKATGGTVGASDEIVLEKDTDYMIRCINQTSSDTELTIGIFWYEEDEYQA
jgi:hypothetical protein